MVEVAAGDWAPPVETAVETVSVLVVVMYCVVVFLGSVVTSLEGDVLILVVQRVVVLAVCFPGMYADSRVVASSL